MTAIPHTCPPPSYSYARSASFAPLFHIAKVWQRFPASLDYNAVWGPFLEAVQPIMYRMRAEAAADK